MLHGGMKNDIKNEIGEKFTTWRTVAAKLTQ